MLNRDIAPKFGFDDKVWIVVSSINYGDKKCEVCEGSGSIEFKERQFICPQCHGSGFYKDTKTTYGVRGPYSIEAICLNIEKDEKEDREDYMVLINGSGTSGMKYFSVNELYASEEKAQNAADEFKKEYSDGENDS